MIRFFPISKFAILPEFFFSARNCHLFRFSSTKNENNYSINDFLNEDLDEIVEAASKMQQKENVPVKNFQFKDNIQHNNKISDSQPQQQKKTTPTPPKSMSIISSNNKILQNNRNTIEAARNAMRSGGVVSAFAPLGNQEDVLNSVNVKQNVNSTPHSLSEFLFACNELVVEAKQSHQQQSTSTPSLSSTSKVEQYWNLHVSRIVEMNCRSTHDLACVSRAGKGFGLSIPTQTASTKNIMFTNTTNSNQSSSVVFNAWNIVSRYQNTARCLDVMSAMSLLVKSQPPLPQAPSPYQSIDDDVLAPKYRSFCSLHAGHQKLAMENVRFFFVAATIPAVANPSKHDQSTIFPSFACSQSDYEAICDVLSILDHLTNAKRKQFWPSPPKHISAKYWETVGNLMRVAVPKCSDALSFTQLVQCLVDCKKLYISCNYLLSEEEDEEIKLNEKLRRIRSSSSIPEHQNQQNEMFLSEKSKSTRRHLKRALRNARSDIAFSGVIALLKMMVAQAVTLDKFVNSFHFTEVLDVIYVLNLQFYDEKRDDNNNYVVEGETAMMNRNSRTKNGFSPKEIRIVIDETLEMMRDVYQQRVIQEKNWKLFSSNNDDKEKAREKEQKLKAKLKKVLNV